jgi:hypothetical protein
MKIPAWPLESLTWVRVAYPLNATAEQLAHTGVRCAMTVPTAKGLPRD